MSSPLPYLPLPRHRPIPSKYRHLLKEKDSYQLARNKWILNDYTNLELELSQTASNYKTYILGALDQIFVHANAAKAKAQLQQALAIDFKAKFDSEYLLANAQILFTQKSYYEAGLMFRNLCKNSETQPQIKLYAVIGLAKTLFKMGKKNDALATLSDNMITSNQVASAEIALRYGQTLMEAGELDQALVKFVTIKSEEDEYITAQHAIANITQTTTQSLRSSSQILHNLFERNATVETALLLGDFLLENLELEQAIAVYQKAIKTTGVRSELEVRIGQALVKSHDYAKAIKYYERALNSDNRIDSPLRYDLAELYYNLTRIEDATKLITSTLIQCSGEALLYTSVKFLRLYALVQQAQSNSAGAIESLVQCKALLTSSSSEEMVDHVNGPEAARVCIALAKLYEGHNADQELQEYETALRLNPVDKEPLTALLKRNLKLAKRIKIADQAPEKRSYIESAQSILTSGNFGDDQLRYQAEIDILRGDHQAALKSLAVILASNPRDWDSLEAYLLCQKRLGYMATEGARQLDASESTQNTSESLGSSEGSQVEHLKEEGWYMCSGILLRFTGQQSAALRAFALARKAPHLWESSVQQMARIVLSRHAEMSKAQQTCQEDIANIISILQERSITQISPETQALRLRLLSKVSSKSKVTKELSVLASEHECVTAELALAESYFMGDQALKGKAVLKKITQYLVQPMWEEDIESACIQMAYIYLNDINHKEAQDILSKALLNNKSSTAAYECSAFIQELKDKHIDAADHYQIAWSLTGETSASLGYKLSYNLMKSKQWTEAIEVCFKVLKKWPDYPLIKTEVLHKARAGLRGIIL